MIDKDNRLPICFRSAFCLSFGRMPAGFSLILVLLALLTWEAVRQVNTDTEAVVPPPSGVGAAAE